MCNNNRILYAVLYYGARYVKLRTHSNSSNRTFENSCLGKIVPLRRLVMEFMHRVVEKNGDAYNYCDEFQTHSATSCSFVILFYNVFILLHISCSLVYSLGFNEPHQRKGKPTLFYYQSYLRKLRTLFSLHSKTLPFS